MAVPTQVEAKSLSAINQLAAHPPQYPINPVGRHETLCLYISRVPGSRGKYSCHLTRVWSISSDRHHQMSSCPRSSLRGRT